MQQIFLPIDTTQRLRRNCSPPLNVTTKEKLDVCVVKLKQFLFFPAKATFQLQKIFDVAFPESEADMVAS